MMTEMEKPYQSRGNGNMVTGVTLIVLGVLFLLRKLFPELFDIDFRKYWPVLLIIAGVLILWKDKRKGN
jgi:hypothetical protein